MVEGGGDESAVAEVVLGDHFEGVAGFYDGEEAVVGNEVEVIVGDDGGGAVLAGGVEAFVVDDVASGGVDAGEDAAVADEVEAVLVEDGRGEFGDAAAEFPGDVGVGDVPSGMAIGRTNGSQPRFEWARSEIGDEFFAGPDAVTVFINVVENAALALGAFLRIGRDGDAEPGMRGWDFGAEWEGEVFGDFGLGDCIVLVGIEVEHRVPEWFEVWVFFSDAAHGGGSVDKVLTNGWNDGGFARESGDKPFFGASGWIISCEAATAEDDEVFGVIVGPDGGGGPTAAVKRSRCFPDDFAGFLVESNDA